MSIKEIDKSADSNADYRMHGLKILAKMIALHYVGKSEVSPPKESRDLLSNPYPLMSSDRNPDPNKPEGNP